MTTPTTEQLRTEQPADPTLTINRERLRTLTLVDQGRVRRSDGGKDVLGTVGASAGYGSRIRVVDLWRAGLVVLVAVEGGNHYRLTGFGGRRRAEATAEYDRNSIAGGAPTVRHAPAQHA